MILASEKPIDVRLNELTAKLTSNDFKMSDGLGNEVPFYIFDYDPSDEYIVREYLAILQARGLDNAKFVNVYALIIKLLQAKGYLQKTFDFEQDKGTEHVTKVVYRTLGIGTSHDKVAEAIVSELMPGETLIITGLGAAYPIIRGHTILNSLLGKINHNPLIMFYPGKYTGQSLSLFNQISGDNYYRAFQIVGRS